MALARPAASRADYEDSRLLLYLSGA